MIVWWFMYLVICKYQLCLDQSMIEFLKQAAIHFKVLISFSLPVGIVVGEILSGIWELSVAPLFENAKDNANRSINIRSRPFEYFATRLGDKFKPESEGNIKDKKANITIREFASIFNQENTYNASEIHFALARCLGGISIGLLGGLVLGACSKVSKKVITYTYGISCRCILIILTLIVLLVLFFCWNQTKDSLIMRAILIFSSMLLTSFVAFLQSIRYRDFANFIIIISEYCNVKVGKSKV